MSRASLTTIAMFFAFVAVTLVITYWAARKTSGASGFFAANRSITAWQNGLAVAGDYMSAASFLGIAGMIAFYGFDGFMYSVGFLMAYLTVLFLVAEPLRNAGKYTMADLLAYRMRPRPVRAMASFSTLTVSTFYMIAQMVGAGTLVALLLKGTGISYPMAVTGIGILMVVYVVFGGMLATTWVQIIKAVLLLVGTFLLSFLVLKHFAFDLGQFFESVSKVSYTDKTGAAVTADFLEPGRKFMPPWGHIDLISLSLALVLGTAGLPHVLVRFYTVPDAKTARHSVVWAMLIIGVFYILTTFLGFGAATIVGQDNILVDGKPNENMSAPLLAQALGGDIFFAFIAAIAFATILAVVAGLTISASTSFAHDVWTNVIKHKSPSDPKNEVRVARITALVVGAISILAAILLGDKINVAFLVGLAFAVAASGNLPVILFSIFWKRFNTVGAVTGMAVGLISSIALICISPSIMGTTPKHFIQMDPLFPLTNPGLISIPLGFLGAYLGTILSKPEEDAEEKFMELHVRAETGLGAEKATPH
ncbi:MAG: cation acetate symporter [Verrucomicrobiota bacterium]|nr:cation acetate symporter [Verrucomicrobiota bacterium]